MNMIWKLYGKIFLYLIAFSIAVRLGDMFFSTEFGQAIAITPLLIIGAIILNPITVLLILWFVLTGSAAVKYIKK